jgi:Mg-chelatase subunit ChlD
MTPESPINPRQALEASLTALILGELPPDQAEFLQRTIAQDPELSQQYERLKKTIELVRETEVVPANEPIAQPAPLKLSHDRREKLLQHFKTVSQKEFAAAPRRATSWLVPMAAAVVLVAVLASALLPTLSRAKFSPSKNRGYSEFAAKGSHGTELEELRRLDRNPVSAGTEAVLAPLPNQQPATAIWGGPAVRSHSEIVLPSAGKPITTSAAESENAPNLGLWTVSANSKGFYDDSFIQSLPSGAATAQSEPAHLALNEHTLSGGVGGLGGGTFEKGGLPSVSQDGDKLADLKQGDVGLADGSVPQFGRGRLQEALRNSAEPGGRNADGSMLQHQLKTSEDVISFGGVATQPSEAAARAGAEAAFRRSYGLVPGNSAAEPAKIEQTSGAMDANTGLPIAQAGSLPMLNYGVAPPTPAARLPGAAPLVSRDIREQQPNKDVGVKTPALGDSPTFGGRLFAGAEKQQALELAKTDELKEKLIGQKTRQLDELDKSRSLPKNKIVEIVEPAKAETDEKLGLLAEVRSKLSGEVERKARIKVEGSEPMATLSVGGSAAYDPYFVQTEFESIQSDAVLGKVVDKLSLNEAWAKKKGAADTLKAEETIALLKDRLDLRAVPNSNLVEIGVKSDKPEEAAQIANTIAEVYLNQRREQGLVFRERGIQALNGRLAEQESKIAQLKQELESLQKATNSLLVDSPLPKPAAPAPIPQPEVQTRENAFSTFSLNVSDVSFKLAAASLEKGLLPEAASIRSEEFINAFDYRDPEPAAGAPVAFAWERARYPFTQNRDLLRFSLKTAAQGRQAGRPLNVVLLLDNSGSMERADRVSIIREALRALAGQLQTQDTLSVVLFARTARLWVDGVPGNQAAQVAEQITGLTPEGGTNLEEAMNLAYQTALRHYLAGGINRVVLLTDGAANLGTVDPKALKKKVEANRKQGIALDCFGIGWEGYNDDLLEILARNSDGRYGFINAPEEAAREFVTQLAGALQVAASDVKVQVEFNPNRVTAYRQIGYAKHQLTKEQFRDNTVDAAEIGAEESGNALYVIENSPSGVGPLATVRARYKVPGTADYHEHEWTVPFTGNASLLEQSSPAMRLAATASAFSEWLSTSPFAAEVTPDALLAYLNGVPEVYGADQRPRKLEWMVRQAKSITGK